MSRSFLCACCLTIGSQVALADDRPTPKGPAERTAKMLVRQHQDAELKAFKIWPFGDLGKEEKKEPPKP